MYFAVLEGPFFQGPRRGPQKRRRGMKFFVNHINGWNFTKHFLLFKKRSRASRARRPKTGAEKKIMPNRGFGGRVAGRLKMG